MPRIVGLRLALAITAAISPFLLPQQATAQTFRLSSGEVVAYFPGGLNFPGGFYYGAGNGTPVYLPPENYPALYGLPPRPTQYTFVMYPSALAATIVIRAPENVAVSVDGKDLPPAEPARTFVTPPLETGKSQVYTVRLKWTEDGREVTQEEHITVQAGGRKSLTILPSATKQAPRMPRPRK